MEYNALSAIDESYVCTLYGRPKLSSVNDAWQRIHSTFAHENLGKKYWTRRGASLQAL